MGEPQLGKRLSGAFILGRTEGGRRFQTGLGTAARPRASAQAVGQDGRFILLMEGRITNRATLSRELGTAPPNPSGDDDALLALASYERNGIDGLGRVDGSFAMAIYDQCTAELTLVRDRAGHVPLYYHHAGPFIHFATDLDDIARASASPLALDMRALELYLQLTYIPAPFSIYEGVEKLPPGTYVNITATGIGGPRTYWDIDYSDTNQLDDYEGCKVALRERLTTAVEEALSSADEVGTLLSGGIDSTIITGLASTVLKRPIDSFTMSFANRGYDESGLAQLSADLHGTNHHHIPLNPQDILPQLDEFLLFLDEPYGNSSYPAACMVSHAARQHVNTVLSGEAGDELFAGYSKYLIGHYSSLYNKVPSWLATPSIHLVNSILPAQSHLRRKMNKVAESAGLEPYEQRERLMSLGFYTDQVGAIMAPPSPGKTRDLIRGHYDKYSANEDELRRALYLDFKVVLEGDMLAKAHYAGRASGLQTQTPMLSRPVMEIAARIPSRYKITSRTTKAILKDAFSDLIPSQLLSAPKTGFSLPMGTWMRQSLRRSIETVLSEERIRDEGILNYQAIHKLKREHFEGEADHASRLWLLYVLMKWSGARKMAL